VNLTGNLNAIAIAITRDANDPTVFSGILHAGRNKVSVVDLRSGLATFGTLVPGAQITLPAPLNQSHIA